jgi:hypothetical protein
MASPHVLIVAPDTTLRHSLRFALEAEHFQVSWRASLGAKPMPGEYDCTIVDHHALGGDLQAAETFLAAFKPVILLANGPHQLSPLVFRTILKPGLGAPVIQAVHDAIGTDRTPPK